MPRPDLLLHICCAPCTIYPLKIFRSQDIEVGGFFYNPNIHPFLEFKKRLETFKQYARLACLPAAIDARYYLRDFLRMVVGKEDDRCRFCYRIRLLETAKKAREGNYQYFSSTLLYSRFQRHDLIREIAENAALEYKIPFFYYDFREGWEEGISEAKALGIYRQPYCGCIYSEQERYDRSLRRKGKCEPVCWGIGEEK